ncbi:hypothetical protein ACM66B_000772 [Microbotryomycetes sp. NB124-2]
MAPLKDLRKLPPLGPDQVLFQQRDPGNKYDANAVKVTTVDGVQVGHIPRNVASRLAPGIDRGLIQCQGTCQSRKAASQYSLRLTITIMCEPKLVGQVKSLLGWVLRPAASPATPRPAALPTYPQPAPPVYAETYAAALSRRKEFSNVLSAFEKSKDEKSGDQMLDSLTNVKDVLKLPVHESPPSIASGHLKSDLLRHQLQVLKWMTQQENPALPEKPEDPPVQLLQAKEVGEETMYYNWALKQMTMGRPTLARGGILADAMGLGKTLQVLALIVSTLRDKVEGCDGGTLIVAPVSVLSNWTTQAAEHVSEQLSMTVHLYHGDGRKISVGKLKNFDVVVTAYSTLCNELVEPTTTKASPAKQPPKKKRRVVSDDSDMSEDEIKYTSKPKRKTNKDDKLFQIKWRRVCLDEAHTIANPKTKTARAAYKLDAYARWALTGTPLVNSASDLMSLLTFLQMCKPLDEPAMAKELIVKPLARGDSTGAHLLRLVMSSICLRRTKEMRDPATDQPILQLPKIE